jgi:glutamyl-tRNA reductase
VETVARALRARFEEVSRAELNRLRRKTSSLSAAQREQVDDIAVEVVRGIASRAVRALRDEDDSRLAPVVAQLFRI